ncbi:diacylglycerol/lipid kinase family protein [Granulosicoccus antarcticus]|uniref:Putative lipid kinase YegS n=1 Tax=Granulosicoccus antarcticus IMCC3135 TaxID=1192854 RepID=A0A2Z2NUV7_9GAMM|nr:diacylglycerol kinase family protein [Granulosicoccus antarcticus]ASJ74295.1 putative lipid kinase YegS [Granulosicoccus antarcticus IMCC3135]
MMGDQPEAVDIYAKAPSMNSNTEAPSITGPLVIYMNDQSGNRDTEEMRRIIQAELESAQRPFMYLGRESAQSLEQALTSALDKAEACSGTLVVSGGDGTINAAIALAVGRQQALAIIPSGTFNFVARSHGIPEDTGEAVKLILCSRPQATRVGMINDRQFMVNASIGSYARLQREREGFKKTLGRTRGVASLAAIVSALHQSSRMRLNITSQSRQTSVDCSTLILCNNRLQLELVGVDSLPGFGKDEMVCAVLAPVGVATQLATIWRGFWGRVSETPELNTFVFNEIKIDIGRRRSKVIDVSVDGEACKLRLPLVVKVSEKPQWLVRPLLEEEVESE